MHRPERGPLTTWRSWSTEVTGRREGRIQRRIQDARFRMLKTLDVFSCEAQPDLEWRSSPAASSPGRPTSCTSVEPIAASDLLPGEAMCGRST